MIDHETGVVRIGPADIEHKRRFLHNTIEFGPGFHAGEERDLTIETIIRSMPRNSATIAEAG